MTRAQRLGLLALGAAIAVVAFLALRPDQEEDRPGNAARDNGSMPAPQRGAGEEKARPRAKPSPPLLRAGTVRTLNVRKGEQVRFRVRAEEDEEVHVHGYDITKQAPAGRTVTVRFPARLEGVFEIELEHSKTLIARLRVEP